MTLYYIAFITTDLIPQHVDNYDVLVELEQLHETIETCLSLIIQEYIRYSMGRELYQSERQMILENIMTIDDATEFIRTFNNTDQKHTLRIIKVKP